MKAYPAVGGTRDPDQRKNGGSPCIVCGVKTTGKVFIELSIFRGDDDVVWVCKEHQKTRYHAEIIERHCVYLHQHRKDYLA